MAGQPVSEEIWRQALHCFRSNHFREAHDGCAALLEREPNHYDALLLLGELYALWTVELGVTEPDGSRVAVRLFDRAIAVEPENPEAYDSKGIALLQLREWALALECSHRGLACLHLRTEGLRPCPREQHLAASLLRTRSLAHRGLSVHLP